MTDHERQARFDEPLPEVIDTPRLQLTIWHPAHAEALGAAVTTSLEDLQPWMPWAADEPLAVEERRQLMVARRSEWSDRRDGYYTVWLGDRLIGSSGLHRRDGALEIGYWIDSGHTDRGFATEVAKTLAALASAQRGDKAVEIHHSRINTASGRVADKAGFVFAGQRSDTTDAPGGDGLSWVWRYMDLPGFTIRPERVTDHAAIDEVVGTAFGSATEVGLVHDIRRSPRHRFGLVAEIDGETERRVVGHVMISECTLDHGDGTSRLIVMLSPLAVAPDVHRRGVGGALVKAAIDGAAADGEGMVVVEGDPAYYGRFGFEPADAYGITMPLPDWAPREAGQVMWLNDRRHQGTVVYPPAFDGLE